MFENFGYNIRPGVSWNKGFRCCRLSGFKNGRKDISRGLKKLIFEQLKPGTLHGGLFQLNGL